MKSVNNLLWDRVFNRTHIKCHNNVNPKYFQFVRNMEEQLWQRTKAHSHRIKESITKFQYETNEQ